MSIVSTGAADVADEPPEDRASHDAAIAGLQVVRAGQNNSTKFGNSILGGEEVLSILQHSKKKHYLQNSSGSPLWKQRLQCFTSLPFMMRVRE